MRRLTPVVTAAVGLVVGAFLGVLSAVYVALLHQQGIDAPKAPTMARP